ncbi:MAG: hypothetical protein OXN89_01665 [Bryobacterales bacterium]|nr:hypothetical protein [Bryobacterales bacterium]
MRSLGRLCAVLTCALTSAGAQLAAADLTGTWIGTIPSQGRTTAKDVVFRLVQNGSSISGKAYNDQGASNAIIRGSVTGDKLDFEVELIEQAGNQINFVVYRYSGAIKDGEIDMTRERAAARSSVSGANIPVRRPGDTEQQDRERRFRTFLLERLYR